MFQECVSKSSQSRAQPSTRAPRRTSGGLSYISCHGGVSNKLKIRSVNCAKDGTINASNNFNASNPCCNYVRGLEGPSCAICSVALPSSSQCRSLTPEASATNKRAVHLVSVVNPAVEVPGSAGVYQYCCKPCFSKLERAERSLETARGANPSRKWNSCLL